MERVARRHEKGSVFTCAVRKPYQKGHLKDLGADARLIFKLTLKKYVPRALSECMWLRNGEVASFCELGAVRKYENNQKMFFNIYYVFYAQCPHQHASVGILAVYRVFPFFLQVDDRWRARCRRSSCSCWFKFLFCHIHKCQYLMCPISCGHSFGIGILLFISPIGDIYVFGSYMV